MKERRRHPRREMRLSASVRKGSKLQKYYTKNMSGGGLFLEVDDPPPVGEHIEIELSVPGKTDPLLLKAEVVRHHSFYDLDEDMNQIEKKGVGVKFIDISDETRKAIEEILAST